MEVRAGDRKTLVMNGKMVGDHASGGEIVIS
jgi:hypothetical protein